MVDESHLGNTLGVCDIPDGVSGVVRRVDGYTDQDDCDGGDSRLA